MGCNQSPAPKETKKYSSTSNLVEYGHLRAKAQCTPQISQKTWYNFVSTISSSTFSKLLRAKLQFWHLRICRSRETSLTLPQIYRRLSHYSNNSNLVIQASTPHFWRINHLCKRVHLHVCMPKSPQHMKESHSR